MGTRKSEGFTLLGRSKHKNTYQLGGEIKYNTSKPPPRKEAGTLRVNAFFKLVVQVVEGCYMFFSVLNM